jgi:hypothetical protein
LVLLIQLTAYVVVAFVVLLLALRSLRMPGRKSEDGYSFFEYAFIGFRILLSSAVASVAMLCSAQAIMHFPNLPLLAMLPVSGD